LSTVVVWDKGSNWVKMMKIYDEMTQTSENDWRNIAGIKNI
jgi:hypothetical protein